MSKTVTLRIGENIYDMFRAMAERENRPLSNFIETAALRYLQEHELVDEFEMREISQNINLFSSMKRGHADVKVRKGSFV